MPDTPKQPDNSLTPVDEQPVVVEPRKAAVEAHRGEYIPAAPPPPPAPRRGLFRRSIGIISFIILIAAIIGALWFGRQWYDSLLVRMELNKTVHTDSSEVSSGVRAQVKPQVTLLYSSSEGEAQRVLADADAYSAFTRNYVTALEDARVRISQTQKQQLHAALDKEFATMRGRIQRFADWYFSYTTTYKLLWHASTSAAGHAVSLEAVSLGDAVSHDLEVYLHQHYEKIVLRPEITDARLKAVYLDTLHGAQQAYIRTLAQLEAGFQSFVKQHTTHLQTEAADRSRMALDWRSQFHKLHMAEYEKNPEGAFKGGAMAVGGAMAGKAVGGAAGKAVAGKMIAGSAAKGVFAKLSAPFVSKAVAASAGGAAGTLGGPVGTLLGIAGGLGVDYLLNEGVELAQRDNFVSDVTDALDTTRLEWETEMQAALEQAIDVWFNDSIHLVPQYGE